MRSFDQAPTSAPASSLTHPIRLADILSPRTPLTSIPPSSAADGHHPIEVEVEIVDDDDAPMSGWSHSTLSTPAPTPLSSAFRPISRRSGRRDASSSLARASAQARAFASPWHDADADADVDALGDAPNYREAAGAASAPFKLRLELPPAVKFRTRLSRLAASSSSPLDGVWDTGRTPPNTASAGEGRELSMGETRSSRASFSISSWSHSRLRPSADVTRTTGEDHPAQEASPSSATIKSPLNWLRRVSGSPASPTSPSTGTRAFWGLPSPLQRIRTPRTTKGDSNVRRTWTVQLDKKHSQVVFTPPQAKAVELKSPLSLPTPVSADAPTPTGQGAGEMSPMSPLPPLRTPGTPSGLSMHSVCQPGDGTYRISVETASTAGIVLLMHDEDDVRLARLSLGQEGDKVELYSPAHEAGQVHGAEHKEESSGETSINHILLQSTDTPGGDSLRLFTPAGVYTWRTTPGLALCHSPSREAAAKISWRPLGRTRFTITGLDGDRGMTLLLMISAAKVWLDRQANRDFRL